ncbi:hypothetical protein RIF29_21796 [Crotalaria pallida]|uniref:Uncharacterized protein n=1 Tax=Crotalaria pallida TaxID=3830 RepID=A0AAN9I9S4_CROPI
MERGQSSSSSRGRGRSHRGSGGTSTPVQIVREGQQIFVQPEQHTARNEFQSFFVVEVTNKYDNNESTKLISSFRSISQPSKSSYILRGECVAHESRDSSRVFLMYENGIPLQLPTRKEDLCMARLRDLLCSLHYLFNTLGKCHSNLSNIADAIVYSRGSAKLAAFLGCKDNRRCNEHKRDDLEFLFHFFNDQVNSPGLRYFSNSFPYRLLWSRLHPVEVFYFHPIFLTSPISKLHMRVVLYERLSLLDKGQRNTVEDMCFKKDIPFPDDVGDYKAWRSRVMGFPILKENYLFIYPGSAPSPSPDSAPSPSSAPPAGYPIKSYNYHFNELLQFAKFCRNAYFHCNALAYSEMEKKFEDFWCQFTSFVYHLLISACAIELVLAADFKPTDKILLSCGGPPSSTDADGRDWTTDVGSKFESSSAGNSTPAKAATQAPAGVKV